MKFDDYHRTVIGYHGTKLSTARRIINREQGFKKSQNDDDWLGHGVYFWEYAPQQALWWAEKRRKKQNWGDEPIAIVASMIRLGFCFDLLDPKNVEYLKTIHQGYVELFADKTEVPENFNNRKYLDCSVFQYAYATIESDRSLGISTVDTARAVYVPSGNGTRIWKRSWITVDSHIQICVRNPKCILGTWLYYPDKVEDTDEIEKDHTPAISIEFEDQAGSGKSEEDVV